MANKEDNKKLEQEALDDINSENPQGSYNPFANIKNTKLSDLEEFDGKVILKRLVTCRLDAICPKCGAPMKMDSSNMFTDMFFGGGIGGKHTFARCSCTKCDYEAKTQIYYNQEFNVTEEEYDTLLKSIDNYVKEFKETLTN